MLLCLGKGSSGTSKCVLARRRRARERFAALADSRLQIYGAGLGCLSAKAAASIRTRGSPSAAGGATTRQVLSQRVLVQ